MKKLIAAILIIAVVIGGCYYAYITFFAKTDEEKIEDCLQTFASAYSSGDSEALCKCLDSKSQIAIKSILGIGNSFSKIGLENIFGTMFSLNSISAGEDSVQFDIKEIKVNGDKASVKLEMKIVTSVIGKHEQTSSENVKMVKEGMDWKIVGLTN